MLRTYLNSWLVLVVAFVASRVTLCAAGDAVELSFEGHIRPILKAHCFHCHGEEEKHEAGLDVRLVRFLTKGGDSGAALVTGKPDESLMWQRIAKGEMPPGEKKLSTVEQATIRRWIEQGAKTARPEPETVAAESPWTDEEKSFWSFQPVKRPLLPTVKVSDSLRSPVDAFLMAELERRGFSFSPPAEKRTIARRLHVDLLGLPPSPEEIDEFVADELPDSYERLVDRLLGSPRYGERWGRHWLDPAGYADSDGYTDEDPERRWAFRYRDYVIRSFNADKPLNEFVREQLAGDELLLPPYSNLTPEQLDRLAATGFLRMAPDGTASGGVDQNLARNDVIAESIKIVSSSLLGMTVGCAQCHNHRYDPISQVDYYRFRALFEPAYDWKNWRPPGARLVNLWTSADHEQAKLVDAEIVEIQKQRNAEINQIVAEIFARELAKLDEELYEPAREARNTPADKREPFQQQLLKEHPSLNVDTGSATLYEPQRVAEWDKKFKTLEDGARAKRPPDSFVVCLTEVPGQMPPTVLFSRGDINQPRQTVTPSELSVLPAVATEILLDDPQLPTTGRRLAYARHLTSGQHPLLGRVVMNRVWLNHFGRGLVGTPADFGVLGERPSHPELLDWLATELPRREWQLKELQRLIVTSAAFRQSSSPTVTATEKVAVQTADPDNRWLARAPVRRLEAEAIRDAILATAGSLSQKMYGPPLTVLPDEVGQIVVAKGMRDGNGILIGKTDGLGEDETRRTLYVQMRRSMTLGMLEPFDAPTVSPNCERRNVSTATPQSLLMMNSDFLRKQSELFAARVQREAGDDLSAQISRAWQLAFGVPVTSAELARSQAFIDSQRPHFEAAFAAAAEKEKPKLTPSQQSLALLCHTLLCSNRFLYVE